MTQMAGTNPKIAAIFGGNGFGMDYGKMNNHAFEMQSDLQNAATMADANVNLAEQEAEYIRESAEYGANAIGAQASAAGNAQMVGQIGSALSGVAGMSGGGGIGGFAGSVNSPGFGMNRSTQNAFGAGGGSVGGFGTLGPNWGFPSS